jgi:hypothetical protein
VHYAVFEKRKKIYPVLKSLTHIGFIGVRKMGRKSHTWAPLSKPGAEQAYMKSMQTYQTSFLEKKLKNCKTFLFVKKRICKNETFAVFVHHVCVTLCKPK